MKRAFAFLLIALFSSALAGQAALKVKLRNAKTQQAVPQMVLTVRNPDIGFEKVYRANALGIVQLNGLSTAGAYQLVVGEDHLYYRFESDPIRLRSNASASVILSLISKSSEQLAEAEIVAGKLARINTVNAEVSSELPEREIQEIPLEGRDITQVLYRLPNVTRATGFYPEAPNVSINGANSLFTSYLINGMDNNERFLGGQRFAIPMGMVQQITVLANNYSAEYGQSANGLFDITTKAGSNEVQGEVFYVLRPGQPLDASSPFASNDLYGRAVNDGFRRHQFGFSVGTPLVKDQTFLFLNAEQTMGYQENLLNVPELLTNETIEGNNYFSLLSARLDHYWSPKWRSTLRTHYGNVELGRRGGGNLEPIRFREAGYTQARNSFTLAFSTVYNGRRFHAETNYQLARMDWLYLDPVNAGLPSVALFGPDDDQQPLALLGETLGNFDLLQRLHQFQQKFIFHQGNHRFKAGLDVLSTAHSDLRGGNGLGAYNVYLSATQLDSVAGLGRGADLSHTDLPRYPDSLTYAVELRPETFKGRQHLISAYVEDRWNLNPSWTLIYGLRYDFDNLSQAGSDGYDLNNFGPRLNLNYTLNGQSSLRAGYGLFYDKIVYAVYSDALAGSSRNADYLAQLEALRAAGALPAETDVNRITYQGNSAAFFGNQQVNYLHGPTASELGFQQGNGFAAQRTILNPQGLNNPYAHHFMLGYQYQVNKNLLFYADAMYKRSDDQLRLVDVNAPAPFKTDTLSGPGGVRSARQADASRPVSLHYDARGRAYGLFRGDTLRNIARKVFMTESGGEAEYIALNVNLVKDRGVDNYAYRFSYTLSRLRNNTEDINFIAADANDFEAEWGPSLNDRRHVINAMVYYYPWKGFVLNASALMQSGQPVNLTAAGDQFGTTDLNGDGGSVAAQYTGTPDRYPGVNRNSERLPWAVALDLGMAYRFALAEGQKLELRADVFNVFNRVNYSGYTSNFTQSNQFQTGPPPGRPYQYRNAGRPRQFQFSLRYLF